MTHGWLARVSLAFVLLSLAACTAPREQKEGEAFTLPAKGASQGSAPFAFVCCTDEGRFLLATRRGFDDLTARPVTEEEIVEWFVRVAQTRDPSRWQERDPTGAGFIVPADANDGDVRRLSVVASRLCEAANRRYALITIWMPMNVKAADLTTESQFMEVLESRAADTMVDPVR